MYGLLPYRGFMWKTIVGGVTLAILAACSQATPQGVEDEAVVSDTPREPQTVSFSVPKPVEHFEMYCYRTGGDYKRIVEMAELMKLDALPEKYQAVLGPIVGGGKSFKIEVDKDARQVVVLGVSERNTCAIMAGGYDEAAIRESIIANYNLKEVMVDDTGLQINGMFIPNGVKGTQGEAASHGLISVTRGKAEGVGITVAYVSPEAAKQLLELE